MNTLTRRVFLFVSVLAVVGFFPAAARADRQDELRDRFKGRFDDVRDAKAAGKIGETFSGTVDAIDGQALDDKMKKLVEEENADRRELYKLIAEKEKTSEDKVAERNAGRNFQKAKSGEFLKDRDGKWKKKK